MSTDGESIVLLNRWRMGDERAAEEIFARYVGRLAGLARNRLAGKMQRRVDADDVVQSAFCSFFRDAQKDRYELKRSGDLWRLLAAITVKKALGQVEFHEAAKRSVDKESVPCEDAISSVLSPVAIAREPTVQEIVGLVDEIQTFMRTLSPLERKVLELRLQDLGSVEIADEISRSTRTVRRILEKVKRQLAERFEQSNRA